MSRFQASTALHFEPSVHPANLGHLFKVFEQSEEQAQLARLNLKLQKQCGEQFYLQFFTGQQQLENIPRSTLMSAARCYAEVFNESWGEDWTLESALAEINNFINCDSRYTPVMSLLFNDDRVVGFSWGFVMDSESLTMDSAPFSNSPLKRHESIEVVRYWVDKVSKQNRLLSIRELGVLKEFRQDKTPFLMLPIFQKAKDLDCNVAFLRTKITSKAFKWSLGIGFVPLQLFMVDGLLLMKGSIKYATEIFAGSIDEARKRKTQVELIGNIKRYLCE
jgi:hypothetical protein